jgi:hypothetical protein
MELKGGRSFVELSRPVQWRCPPFRMEDSESCKLHRENDEMSEFAAVDCGSNGARGNTPRPEATPRRLRPEATPRDSPRLGQPRLTGCARKAAPSSNEAQVPQGIPPRLSPPCRM